MPVPVPGESFTSWVDAVARDSRCYPNQLVVDAWRLRKSRTASMARLDAGLTGRELQQIHAATGIRAEVLNGMRLARYTDQPLPALADLQDEWHAGALSFIRDRFLLRDHSRWCPLCLKESNGRWYLRWKSAWSYACTDHEVFLSAVCPTCYEPQDWIRAGPADRRLFCPGRRFHDSISVRRSSRCSHPLTEVPSTPVTDPVLLSIQKSIDYGFEGSPTVQPGARSALRLFLFPLLVDLILKFRSPDMFHDADPAIASANEEGASQSPSLSQGPTAYYDVAHPLLVAGAIHLGFRLVTGESRHAASEQFVELAYGKIVKHGRAWGSEPEYLPWHQRQLLPPRLSEMLMDRGVIRDSL
ncbi:TniQ family protein [Streptomyces sp. NPDC050732]|uniref:TniQ family protein n=1 Tax=Streptomyces sp. NPDC050732 TaxID=3154632 RepID=UPI00342C50CE